MRISDWSSDVCSSDLVAAVHKVVVPSVHVFISAGHGKREFVINKRGGDKRFCREVVEPAIARRRIHCWRIAWLAGENLDGAASRSEERRVGQACGSTCRFRGSPYP